MHPRALPVRGRTPDSWTTRTSIRTALATQCAVPSVLTPVSSRPGSTHARYSRGCSARPRPGRLINTSTQLHGPFWLPPRATSLTTTELARNTRTRARGPMATSPGRTRTLRLRASMSTDFHHQRRHGRRAPFPSTSIRTIGRSLRSSPAWSRHSQKRHPEAFRGVCQSPLCHYMPIQDCWESTGDPYAETGPTWSLSVAVACLGPHH